MTQPLLSTEGLSKHYPITSGVLKREQGRVKAVDDVDLTIHRGETFGIVGESGCGKSTLGRTLLRLERPTAGTITFDGEDISQRQALQAFRRRTQLLFQETTASFDPRKSVGESITEPLRIHDLGTAEQRRRVTIGLLERVGLRGEDRHRYPHEFSGGQLQRIAIARALVLNPDLIVADEPVAALDVSIQAGILSLLDDLQTAYSLTLVLISHDLRVVREVCDRVAVMYLGEIVECADTETIFRSPQHPYTRSLLASIPSLDPRKRGRKRGLTGDVPDPADPPSGCRFHTRCPEIIPPDGFDIDSETYRGVLSLRNRLADEAGRSDSFFQASSHEYDEPSPDTLRSAIADVTGLPTEVDDPNAETILAETVEFLYEDDVASARERLEALGESICERTHPDGYQTPPGHDATCLRYDTSVFDRS